MRTTLKNTVALVFAATLAVSGAVADEKTPESGTSANRVEEQKPQPDPKRKSTAPATTFTPTEKIKADSSVSFPVDI